MRVLIAEDDYASRVALAESLKEGGHEVVQTESGMDALDVMLRPDAPRLAVFDWMMPDMDGVEVVRRIRLAQEEPPPYLILLTSKNERADIAEGFKAGASDYVTKPFDLGELLARIEVGRQLIETQDALAAKVRELNLTLEELKQAYDQVKTLRGIVPICAGCKRIRTDVGFWQQVDIYVQTHTEAEFSHDLCPDCAQRLYGVFDGDEDTPR